MGFVASALTTSEFLSLLLVEVRKSLAELFNLRRVVALVSAARDLNSN
jgi:hypothetical protein